MFDIRSRTVLAALILFAAFACGRAAEPSPPPPPPPPPVLTAEQCAEGQAAMSGEQTIAAQNRVNRYLHKDVVPKLLPCWQTLTGTGTVEVKVEYRKQDNAWRVGRSEIARSMLPKGQDEVALRCLQEALRDTSFGGDSTDREATELGLSWSFPVPWPKDLEEAAARMISSGGGGGRSCGGTEGPAPACKDCYYNALLHVSYCQNVCTGYLTCRETQGGCNLTPIEPICVTGSVFGNIGGVVMY